MGVNETFLLRTYAGISMHKVRDILRRSDIHRNGQIEYKVGFLGGTS